MAELHYVFSFLNKIPSICVRKLFKTGQCIFSDLIRPPASTESSDIFCTSLVPSKLRPPGLSGTITTWRERGNKCPFSRGFFFRFETFNGPHEAAYLAEFYRSLSRVLGFHAPGGDCCGAGTPQTSTDRASLDVYEEVDNQESRSAQSKWCNTTLGRMLAANATRDDPSVDWMVTPSSPVGACQLPQVRDDHPYLLSTPRVSNLRRPSEPPDRPP